MALRLYFGDLTRILYTMLGGIVDERERGGDSLRRVFKGNDMEDSGKGVKQIEIERERGS